MDSFFATVPLRRKTRVHFHAFMRDVHEELHDAARARPIRSRPSPRASRSAARLICFDEFHVTDIADAMILGRLLDGAVRARRRVRDDVELSRRTTLYPNGLQREHFLPTIELIKQWLDVVEVDGGIDYRLRDARAGRDVYHMPADAAADAALAATFDAMRAGPDEDAASSTIEGRTLDRAAARGQRRLVRFRGAVRRPRSQRDYLELAQRFAVLFLSDIPRDDRATRATSRGASRWLVDILYDHRVKLIASAAAPRRGAVRRRAERAGIPAHGEPAHRDAHARLHGAAARRRRRTPRPRAARRHCDQRTRRTPMQTPSRPTACSRTTAWSSSRFVDTTLDELDPGDVVVRTKYSTINYKDALSHNGTGQDHAQVPDHRRHRHGRHGRVVGRRALQAGRQGDRARLRHGRRARRRLRASTCACRPTGSCALPESMTAFDAMTLGTAGYTAALAIELMRAQRPRARQRPGRGHRRDRRRRLASRSRSSRKLGYRRRRDHRQGRGGAIT